jgi:hypothetical protein
MSRIFYKALEGDISMLDSADELPDGETKDHYLALRKEFNKMVGKRKKFLKKHFPLKPLSDNDASKVEKILIERFKEKGYGDDVMHRTRKLWQDFVKTAKPHIKDSLPWVAALDFIVRSSTLTSFDGPKRVTQKLVAQEYGVSFSQINQCYRKIVNSVKIDRYFSNTDNIEALYRFLKTLFKINKKFKKHLEPIEMGNLRAQEAWLDNIYKYALSLQSGRIPKGRIEI